MPNTLIVIASLAYGSAALRSGSFGYCSFPCDAAALKDVITQVLEADEQLLGSMLKWTNERSSEFQEPRAGAQFWKVEIARPLPTELSRRCKELRKIASALELQSPVLSVTVREANPAERIFQYLNKLDGVSIQI